MMKLMSMMMLMSVVFSTGQAYAMTRVDTPGPGNMATDTRTQVQQSGKLEVVYASGSKLVIDGVTYAYSPLTTVVMVNGKRSTISDLRSGDTIQFQTVSQGAHQPALLTSMRVQRR
ncbi:hypothetical protein [Thiobacillus sp. 0-1251]|uniref:hypothetical protein n=1 Tax=Thiobacillus sp. 0-1251 TaxID=1895858 RepID=UPI00095D65E2|nr:hypothetical protein [Thiobacillus sp. 0-1251]OJY60354.1 MAG: hypothetical protein BGP19_16035 [Thiobacillus sp. 0-1251]